MKTYRLHLGIILTAFLFLFYSCSSDDNPLAPNPPIPPGQQDPPPKNEEPVYGSLEDVEGNKYVTVEIGSQTWMAENLNTSLYNDGKEIPNITDPDEWVALEKSETGAWAYYENDEDNSETYGKLYNWYAVETGKLCPEDWHIPSRDEWMELEDFLGKDPGEKLKTESDGGTNSSGFNGVLGGYRASSGGYFQYIGGGGTWWTSTAASDSNAWERGLDVRNSWLSHSDNSNNMGFSCRCIKD